MHDAAITETKRTLAPPGICRRRRAREELIESFSFWKQPTIGRVCEGQVRLSPEAVVLERRSGSAVEVCLHLRIVGVAPELRANARERAPLGDDVTGRHLAAPAGRQHDGLVESLVVLALLGVRNPLLVAELRPDPIENVFRELRARGIAD